MGCAFEASHAGVRLVWDVAAAGTLLERMAEGAKADRLVSVDILTRGSDRHSPDPGAPRVLASNAVVLATPSGPGVPLQRLAAPAVRWIATGRVATRVPAGRQAREAIDALRLWPAVQRRAPLSTASAGFCAGSAAVNPMRASSAEPTPQAPRLQAWRRSSPPRLSAHTSRSLAPGLTHKSKKAPRREPWGLESRRRRPAGRR
jgi:ABC-type molybdate transport system substrate-binding protein